MRFVFDYAKANRVLTYVNYFVGLVVLVAVGVLVRWYLIPYRTITVEQPIPVLNANRTVTAGQVLSYRISFCKYVSIEATTEKTLEGPVVIILPPPPGSDGRSDLPSHCHVAVSNSTVVPATTPPGRYRLKLTTTYQVNPAKPARSTAYTEYFTVVSPQSVVTAAVLAASTGTSTAGGSVVTPAVAPKNAVTPSAPTPAASTQSRPSGEQNSGPVHQALDAVGGLLTGLVSPLF